MISSSFDGSIGIKEFKRDLLTSDPENIKKGTIKYPIKVEYLKQENRILPY